MDNEGYPEQSELDAIKNWDIKDAFNLIAYLEEKWCYDTAIRKYWGKDNIHGRPVLFFELHTIGWSGNEDILNALLQNQMFSLMWYVKWERGGHYYFEINPFDIGYKKVCEMSKEKGISRQKIHHNKTNYEWIVAGKRNKLCREIKADRHDR